MSKWLEQQKSCLAKSLTVTLRKILWEGLDEGEAEAMLAGRNRQGRDLVPAGQEAGVEVQKSCGKLH